MAQTKIKAGLFEGIIGNGTDGYFLMSNGDGTMTWSSIVINPTITSIAYPGSVTAADPAGGETITVTGTDFKTGATVTIGGTAAPAVSYVSATQITFTTPAKAAGDYDIVVTNTDTGSATYINGISYNGIPTWTTAAGSLGTFASDTTISTITLQATEPDAGTITFSITNGALPTGLSLTGANIDGTTTLETADTLYTFTVTATDDESQATPRTFTITVTKQLIDIENFTINTYTGNGSTLAIEGKIGTAADFNGSSSKIILPENLFNVDTDNHSFSLWVKLDNNTSEQQIVFLGNENLRTETGILRFRRYTGAGNDVDSSAVNANQWYHVVCTFSTTSGMAMYIDGSLIGTNSSTTAMNAGQAKALGIRTDINISYLNGKMDQVRFFNKALSLSEVTTLYGENNNSSTKSTTDIFNDGSGIALYEFEKGAKDTGGTNGYIGAAGVFNGISSRIDAIPTNFPSGNSSRTISFWMYSDSYQSGGIIAYGSASSNQAFAFYLSGNVMIVTFYGVNANINYTLTARQWYHISATFDGTNFKAYVNGSEVYSDTRTLSTGTAGFRIGGVPWNNSSEFFNGKLDQIRIFNKALSSSEVTTLYGETSASATKSTTDIFDDSSGVALYELEGNANDTGGTYNGTSANVIYAYDGTPSNVSFVGTSFQPDLVWTKPRSYADNHQLWDTIRGAGWVIYPNATNAENPTIRLDGVSSFDSNGFTIGNWNNINVSGETYVAWCWKAGGTAVSNTDGTITSQVSANQAAGFSIVKYTGNGVDNATIGHGLSSTPDLIIVKNLNSALDWGIWHSSLSTTQVLRFTSQAANTPGTAYFRDGLNSSTVFGLGTNDETNFNTNNYIAYCFHSVNEYQKVGAYTGTGASGNSVTTGFRPRFVMYKNPNLATAWVIIDSVRGAGTNGKYLFPHTNGTEGAYTIMDFTDTGFTLLDTDNTTNGSGQTYIYLAIA